MSSNTARPLDGPDSKRIFAPGIAASNSQAEQYLKGTLNRHELDADPLNQFHLWFEAAQNASPPVYLPEAVCLSTASLPSGRISSRMVYLKELSRDGDFIIYSNFGTSRKAADIATNNWASLCFWWRELERQVRVEGRVQRLTTEESQVYYAMRARGSRIGAWASPQSSELRPRNVRATDGNAFLGHSAAQVQEQQSQGEEEDDGRSELDERVEAIEERFKGTEDIPVPDFWGGLRIKPELIEFWQGRNSRLHDRFEYRLKHDSADGEHNKSKWSMKRLSP